MAYGQTGSGKTFTMGSEAHPEETTILAQPGLIPRFMQDIFTSLEAKRDASDDEKGPILLDYTVNASFLEVYGEDVHDLTDKERTPLPLREDSQGGVVVSGLKSLSVTTAAEALNVLHIGTLNRTTAATLMNLTSSRSHAVFTVYLTQTTRGGGDVDVKTISKFTFVDLAGSERMKKTGAEGERAKEGIKINEGLLALGNVINALADEDRIAKKEKIHVPYRQSKLTRLLQDALGGNSQTLFLACVSPADVNSSETLSTLHYANRARNIKNAPTKNVDANIVELQRLHALNHILMNELVKSRFGSEASDVDIGIVDQALMQQKDVQDYLTLVYKTADEQQGTVSVIMPTLSCEPVLMDMVAPSASDAPMETRDVGMLLAKTPVRAKHIDTPLTARTSAKRGKTPSSDESDKLADEDLELAGISPDEELAILDQLLDLQQRDQDYDHEHKKDQEQLKLVNGELEEHSAMLLQLKGSLKVYHNMKSKYEALMTEVQQLEAEKTVLAEQLKKVAADPTKGCSLAIQKKVEKVEASLARARADAIKHQQMYRKAEEQAKRCEALERKLSELKTGKVNLIKKQKEAAAKHREYTENKTREISLLKRKEQTDGQKMSKLQTQIRVHEMNLEKRTAYCSKLTDKLKQTESHLMKLLSMRRRELQDRIQTSPKQHFGARVAKKMKTNASMADATEEVSSMTMLLERMVADRINVAQMRMQYEDRVAEYGAVMRSLRAEVAVLDDLRAQGEDTSEAEESLEELELKSELIGSEMEDLKMKLSSFTSDEDSDSTPQEESTQKTVEKLDAALARRLLWDFVDRFATAKLENTNLGKALDRKESALQSLESEVELLNDKVHLCTNELAARRALALSDSDPFESIKALEMKLLLSTEQLESVEKAKNVAAKELKQTKMEMAVKELELAETREKLVLSEVIMRQSGEAHASERTLEVLQGIWREVGVAQEERESVRLQIMSCLEDTCKRKLDEAKSMKSFTRSAIGRLLSDIASMKSSLGLAADKSTRFGAADGTWLEMLDALKKEMALLQPGYDAALERRAKISNDTRAILSSLAMSEDDLSVTLKSLVQTHRAHAPDPPTEAQAIDQTGKIHRAAMMKDVQGMLQALDTFSPDDRGVDNNDEKAFGPPGSLETPFLDKCEKDLSALRLLKTETLAANVKCRDETRSLARKMNVSAEDVTVLCESFQGTLPAWWQKNVAVDVACCISDSDFVIQVSPGFSKHLHAMKESIVSVAEHRQNLSSKLKHIVDRAQKTLLMTVDGELDASEAYASFHEALFQLPPLSQDHIEALITEMDALVAGVDAMTQSEIEALTVVWEALGIRTSERGQFWGKLEETSKSLKSQNDLPFAEVSADGPLFFEKWLLQSAKQAAKIYCYLDVRLHKLETVHSEVERLRSKQDAKSRILSLDSEIRILSARLDEFEELKCNKERLLSKKTGSSSLLKEERFRKQMQGKFIAKLEQLAALLKTWNDTEQLKFDGDLLSEEVRTLVENPNKMDSAVEKRTAFMHLRTVRTKVTGMKRSADKKSADESPAKKQKSVEQMVQSKSPQKQRPMRSAKTAEAPTASSRTRSTSVVTEAGNKRKPTASNAESPVKFKTTRRTRRQDDAKSTPFSPKSAGPNTRQASKDVASSKSKSVRTRETMNPFGNLLPDPTSPSDKENVST